MRSTRRPIRFRSAGLLAAVLVTATACSGGDSAEPVATAAEADPTETTAPASDAAADTPSGADTAELVKPAVDLPATIPTELVVTDLLPGSGPAAETGDIVLVHYVGVRSVDGVEFDNSYDRGQPFPVTLGSGGVIQGWEQGLLGARQGARRQLDIPSDLAYGSAARGDVIRADEPLTFVVDVMAVVSSPDASAAPPAEIDTRTVTVEEITTTDVIDGEGTPVGDGERAFFHYVGYRSDNGQQLESTWTAGAPFDMKLDATDVNGLGAELIGMRVGGRREIVVPAELAFGPEGDEASGVPAGVDLVLLVDLVAIVRP